MDAFLVKFIPSKQVEVVSVSSLQDNVSLWERKDESIYHWWFLFRLKRRRELWPYVPSTVGSVALKKSLNYLPTQTASEVKTSHTRTVKKANQLIHFSNRKQFQICALSGCIVVCVVWFRATWGRSDPELLLSPLKHTPPASPLSHTVFLSCRRSFHLFTLSLFFFWLAIQPAVLLCFMSFPNKQAGRFFFLFLYISEKKLFLFLVHARLGSACVWDRESSEPQTTHNMSN